MRFSICSSLLALVLVTAAGTACQSGDAKKLRFFEQGKAHSAKGEYREAIIAYRKAVQLDERYGEARYHLADAYQEDGQLPQALREMVRAADLLPDRAEAQIRAGKLLVLAGQFEDAAVRARNVIDRDPRNVDALMLLGNASAGLKDSDKAMATLEHAVAQLPEEARLQDSLGFLHARRGNQAGAESAFKRAVEIDPRSIEARQALATYYWTAGRSADAERTLKEALPLDPGFFVSRDLAIFYFIEGRDKEAESYILKVIKQEPKEVTLRVALGDLYTRERRFNEALKVYEPLLHEPASFAAATVRMAYTEYEAGQKNEAYSRLDAGVKRAPRDSDLHTMLARLRLSDKSFQQAEAAARAALQITPERFQALYVLGSALVEENKTEEGVTVLQHAAGVLPNAASPKVQLGRLALIRGDLKTAFTFARDSVTLAPREPLGRLLLVHVLVAQRDGVAAKAALGPLLRTIPNSPEVQSAAGDVAFLNHDRESARRAYTSALAMSPTSLEALNGLVALNLSSGKSRDALALVDRSLAASPSDARTLLLAARSYLAAKDTGRAEALLHQSIKASPSTSLEAYGMLAGLYFSQKRLGEARVQFETMMKEQPKAIAPPTMLGIILQLQGKPKEAQTEYERLLQTHPEAAIAANNLAMIIVETGGNLDMALNYAQSAKKALTDDPNISDTLGLVYYKKGLASLAVTAFEQSTQSQPANPEFWLHLGQAYAAAGNKVKAQDALQRALKLNPQFGGAPIAVKALDDLNKRA